MMVNRSSRKPEVEARVVPVDELDEPELGDRRPSPGSRRVRDREQRVGRGARARVIVHRRAARAPEDPAEREDGEDEIRERQDGLRRAGARADGSSVDDEVPPEDDAR